MSMCYKPPSIYKLILDTADTRALLGNRHSSYLSTIFVYFDFIFGLFVLFLDMVITLDREYTVTRPPMSETIFRVSYDIML